MRHRRAWFCRLTITVRSGGVEVDRRVAPEPEVAANVQRGLGVGDCAEAGAAAEVVLGASRLLVHAVARLLTAARRWLAGGEANGCRAERKQTRESRI